MKNEAVINGTKYMLVREAKSERMQILTRPSTKEALVEIAEEAEISVNELVNRIFESFIKDSKEGKNNETV